SPSTANVTPTGLISGGNVGITTITATKDGVPSNTVNVHVTIAVIDDITITPANVSVAKGQTQPLTAMATYSDGTTSDVTSSVAWSVSRPTTTSVATVTSGGLVSGVDMGVVTVTAMKDGVPSNDVDINVTAAVIDAINITPARLSVIMKGSSKPLTAMATYSDGTTSDVTSSVAWQSYPTATANVTPTGLVSGVKVGTASVSATKDGVSSNTITVEVCTLADACIDVFDTGSGKLFTHSPSVNYLYSIGGSPTDGFFTETGSSGPAGKFYRFNWSNAGLLCAKYNTESLSGRTNWRLPTKDELKVELYDKSGNMFTARSWPSSFQYWSATTNTGSTSTSYYTVGLKNGQTSFDYPTYAYYVSCVSTP
ncbi:Ig-like domain-containing protein, partial [Vibrio ostreicida]